MTDATERRAPVQAERARIRGMVSVPDGTIAWSEYLEAYTTYSGIFGREQTAERLVERGGFGLFELCHLLGRPPRTWEPR